MSWFMAAASMVAFAGIARLMGERGISWFLVIIAILLMIVGVFS